MRLPHAPPRPSARHTPRQRRPRASSAPAFLSWLHRAEPPGGWLVATLLCTTLFAVAGLLFPHTLPGSALRDSLAAASVLAVMWPAGLTVLAARRGAFHARELSALAALTVATLGWMSLRDDQSAGAAGRAVVDTLDDAFGRTGGLILLAIGTAGALVLLMGVDRTVRLLRRVIGPGQPAASRRRPEGTAPHELRLPAWPNRARSDRDLVILGPPSSPSAASPRPKEPPARPIARPVAPGQTEWVRPDHQIVSGGGEAAAFSPADLRARAQVIEETLASFNVEAHVVEAQQGPAITQFGLDPAPGVAVNRIVSRQNDLALRLGAPSLRVLAPVPGRSLVGIEVPNTSVAMVKLGDLLGAATFSRARLPLAIGMDVSGKPVVGDLTRMPHLLIAGATGSGKSVAINSLIASLLIARTPDEVQFVLVDPKQVEMSQYKGLPHLRLPVVTDMQKVVASLRWTMLEMERRYTRFSEVGARNIVAFNERFPAERLGYLIVVIDELADMMMTAAEEVERLICRLAQLGRAAGVHLIVATQRPSVDVLTGLIKANLPTRIAFAVSSQTDSRVILDHGGAERLLGRGDALYQAGDELNPRRVQGAFVSDEEIEALCNHWRAQALPRHTDEDEQQLEKLARQNDPEEKLLEAARELMDESEGEVSVSYLQRRLKIGYQKAARIHQTLIADEAAALAVPPPEEGG